MTTPSPAPSPPPSSQPFAPSPSDAQPPSSLFHATPNSAPDPYLHPLEAEEQRRQVLLRVLRITFMVTFVTVAILGILSAGPGSDLRQIALAQHWPLVVALSLGIGAMVVLIDVLAPRKKIGTLVSIFLGLLASILATLALGWLIDLLAVLWDIQSPGLVSLAKVLIGIGLAYLCITTVLQTQDDFRLVIPYVEFAKELRGPRPLVLDSSALIDARIVDVAATGILQSPLVIPRFVVSELQLMADSSDKLKRARGRRGLDVISRLQRSPALDVSIDEMPVAGKAVDQMLVELARRMPAVIVTTDTGLNRVAGIHGVRVLNLNEVANALKPSVIPGEQLAVRLLKPGEQPGQAVGYLDDGTMVVAEDGISRLGAETTLIVTSTLQTAAGRLIFGRVLDFDRRAEPPAAPAAEIPAAAPASAAPPPLRSDGARAADEGGAADASEPAAPEPAMPADDAGETGPHARPRGPFPPKRSRPNPLRNPRR